jgi:hypothetical protein
MGLLIVPLGSKACRSVRMPEPMPSQTQTPHRSAVLNRAASLQEVLNWNLQLRGGPLANQYCHLHIQLPLKHLGMDTLRTVLRWGKVGHSSWPQQLLKGFELREAGGHLVSTEKGNQC